MSEALSLLELGSMLRGGTSSLAMPLAELDPGQWGSWLLVILEVAFGLGMVIFVHELGHFAVAKMCGVKCDKFMIGFDVGGYKISKQWGETEYGIGILPLGGYVKMLGQDDNPANIADQLREAEASGESEGVETKEIVGPDGEKFLVDRRSYIAKSVPQRMAIISAGVIMNIIFAFIFAVIAFGLGVPYAPCVVSQTAPGSPAYEAGIRPGDEIVKAGPIANPSFNELRGEVMLANLEDGVDFVVRRDEQEVVLRLTPRQRNGGIARIGVAEPSSLRLYKYSPVAEGSPADLTSGGFMGGDEVVAVDGESVDNYAHYVAILASRPGKTVVHTVRRNGKPPEDDPYGALSGGEMVQVSVPPNPLRDVGLRMAMGQIVAVQANSPAVETGIVPGDFIEDVTSADDAPLDDSSVSLADWDPLTLPELLRQLSEQGRQVRLKLRRDGKSVDGRPPTEELTITLRKADWIEEPIGPNDPISVPSLGLAYRVLNRVSSVEPGSPADEAGLRSDDVVTGAQFIYPDSMAEKPPSTKIEFGEEAGYNWPRLMSVLQATPQGTRLKVFVKRDDEEKVVELSPVDRPGYYDPMRGLLFEPIQRVRIAETFGEQISRGYRETKRSLGMVYQFLNKLIEGQVPITALGGPVTIAKAAGYHAFGGVGKLLIFLTMLSANLAVINFLPIPVLDGGHMVFLAYEGVRGRPASEKFVLALHAAGFVAIISLMLFVLALDFELIPRNL